MPWAKPEDLAFVSDQALPKFGGLFNGNFHALMANGGVQFLSRQGGPGAAAQGHHPRRRRRHRHRQDHRQGRRRGREGGPRRPTAPEPAAEGGGRRRTQGSGREGEGETRPAQSGNRRRGAEGGSRKTARLLKEHEELQKTLEKALEQLDALKAERERLEAELHKPGGEKPKPRKP